MKHMYIYICMYVRMYVYILYIYVHIYMYVYIVDIKITEIPTFLSVKLSRIVQSIYVALLDFFRRPV